MYAMNCRTGCVMNADLEGGQETTGDPYRELELWLDFAKTGLVTGGSIAETAITGSRGAPPPPTFELPPVDRYVERATGIPASAVTLGMLGLGAAALVFMLTRKR